MSKQVTPIPDLCAKLLAQRVGNSNGITAKQLAEMLSISPRNLRRVISDLRNSGMAICGHPTTGYYVAETAAELQSTCDFLRSRALHSLVLESRLRKCSLAQLIGQLQLELDSQPTDEVMA